MQNIVTLGEINDALKIAAVTAAQLADMGFAALANKPICEGLPPEESRRLRNAKLYPAESIGQIRVALAQRLAAPAPVQLAQPEMTAALFAARGALQHLKEGGKPTESLLNEAISAIDSVAISEAAPAAVAVPDERAAFEQWLMKELDSIRWETGLKDWYFTRREDGNYMQQAPRDRWEAWQARAALAATPAALEVPAEGDPASLLQLADLLESGRHLIHVERKEVANALRTLAATPAAAPILISSLQSILADADVGPPTDSQWCCKECGRWTPWHHPEAHDHEEGCTAPSEYAKRRDWKSRLSTLIAATPTATAPAHAAEEVDVNAVASIYVTAGGDREFDDWRVQLPIGNNLLYTAPVPADVPATATGLPAQAVKLLAPDHSGMKVDYRGLFSQVQRAIKRTDPGYAEMIRQLESHLQELGQRWYAGDTNVVDEMLQLYCIERDARKTVRQDAASAPQAQADPRDDAELLDAMEQQRIAVVPEYEGPWDAEVYNGDEKPNHRGSGSTPREAIRAAIAAAKVEAQ